MKVIVTGLNGDTNQNKFGYIIDLIPLANKIDKIELIVLGGTWSEYPKKYQDWFICSIYYAANTFYDSRTMYSLEEEITINETSKNFFEKSKKNHEKSKNFYGKLMK